VFGLEMGFRVERWCVGYQFGFLVVRWCLDWKWDFKVRNIIIVLLIGLEKGVLD